MRAPRLVAGLLAVLGAATVAPFARGSASAVEQGAELFATLAEVVEHEDDVEARVARVVALGTDVVPDAVRALAGRAGDRPLVREERELLREALRRWPEERGVQAVVVLLGDEPELSDVTTAARLLGEFAGGRGVAPLFAMARQVPPEEVAHPRVAEELERALAAMLERDTLGFGFLREEERRSDSALTACVVGALGRTPSDEAATMLDRMLGRESELDARVLEAFGLQGPWVERCRDGSCAENVRRYVDDLDPRLRREAVVALGRLGDTASARALVQRLEDRDRRVRAAALWSLRRVSGLGWGADETRWRHELQDEDEWLATTFPGLERDLRSGDPSRARRALHEIAARVLVRHVTAPRLAEALDGDPTIAVATCEALGRLGGPEAMAALIEAARVGPDPVRAAAERAIEALRAEERAAP